jgi:hypothetical protein
MTATRRGVLDLLLGRRGDPVPGCFVPVDLVEVARRLTTGSCPRGGVVILSLPGYFFDEPRTVNLSVAALPPAGVAVST